MTTLPKLPIDFIKNELLGLLDEANNLLLKASPGSGKTTRVPRFLLDKCSGMIFVLEPRRLAAKLAARQVASELGEEVGGIVGYQFRFEKLTSERTRILFLTEGTFLKILANNKELKGVDIVLVDEFHERHLSTDSSLSFLKKIQKEKRPDLKMVVMSATLETQKLELFLQAKTLELNLARFPLQLHYLPNVTSVIAQPLPRKILSAVQDIVEKKIIGDILVFLPGMREIRETQEMISAFCERENMTALILHGDLDPDEQDKVLRPLAKRKVILSTNIAESSVTIAGIRIVIDSGLHRESSFNFFSGLPELKTSKISRASAIQRAGRANREDAGTCFRLFAELDHDQRPYIDKPEIERSDLSELYLISLFLFQTSLEDLEWFEAPPSEALAKAKELLLNLNAIDEDRISAIGKEMLHYPLHPRLSRIVHAAQYTDKKTFQEAIRFLCDYLEEKNKDRFYRQFQYTPKTPVKNYSLEQLLLFGFADRIARSRGAKHFDVVTRNGETLKMSHDFAKMFDPNHVYWIVMKTNHKQDIDFASVIFEEWLYDLEPFPFTEVSLYEWDDRKSTVVKNSKTMIGKIVISEDKSIPSEVNDEIQKIILSQAMGFIKDLEHTVSFERMMTLKKLLGRDEQSLDYALILKDFFIGRNHFNEADKAELKEAFIYALKDFLDPENIYNLDTDLPEFIQLTDKRKLAIQYDRTQDPWIESFIQDFYGLKKTPVLAKGKLPLTLKLLGPHKRALQVTQDLASFWGKTYPQMLKELTREYPRHHWPQNPESAPPILLKRQLPS